MTEGVEAAPGAMPNADREPSSGAAGAASVRPAPSSGRARADVAVAQQTPVATPIGLDALVTPNKPEVRRRTFGTVALDTPAAAVIQGFGSHTVTRVVEVLEAHRKTSRSEAQAGLADGHPTEIAAGLPLTRNRRR